MTLNESIVLFCAFRYALGRSTYVVSSVVWTIIESWNDMNVKDRTAFQKEIREYEKIHGNLGHKMDKKDWYRILKLDV